MISAAAKSGVADLAVQALQIIAHSWHAHPAASVAARTLERCAEVTFHFEFPMNAQKECARPQPDPEVCWQIAMWLKTGRISQDQADWLGSHFRAEAWVLHAERTVVELQVRKLRALHNVLQLLMTGSEAAAVDALRALRCASQQSGGDSVKILAAAQSLGANR